MRENVEPVGDPKVIHGQLMGRQQHINTHGWPTGDLWVCTIFPWAIHGQHMRQYYISLGDPYETLGTT